MRKPLHFLAITVLAVTGGWAVAQPDPSESTTARMLDNVDFLVDNYSRVLTRKYNLTEEQEEYTRALLHEKTDQFLDANRDRMTVLVDRLFAVRQGADMTQDELIDWGREILPVFNEAKRVIVDGNDEWRAILNEEQKAVHDKDLKQMYESFSNTETQLDMIVSGDLTVAEFRNPRLMNQKAKRRMRQAQVEQRFAEQPHPEHEAGSGAVPPRGNVEAQVARRNAMSGGAGGATVERPAGVNRQRRAAAPPRQAANPRSATAQRAARRPTPPRARGASVKSDENFESAWEKYTKDFIQKYQLNEAQTQKAMAILKDCQEQAKRHMQRKEPVLKTLDAQIEKLKASKDATDRQRLARYQKQRTTVLAPLDRIFEGQLKPRLDKLPTRAQRAEAETKKRKPSRARSANQAKDKNE